MGYESGAHMGMITFFPYCPHISIEIFICPYGPHMGKSGKRGKYMGPTWANMGIWDLGNFYTDLSYGQIWVNMGYTWANMGYTWANLGKYGLYMGKSG